MASQATAARTDGDQRADSEAPAKGGKKKRLIIGVVMLALLGGGGYVFLGKSSGAPKAPVEGEVVKMDAIQLNLADGHFLKLGLALQATADAHEAPEGSKALDLAIRLFSQRPMEELSSSKQREKLKEELKEQVIHAYHEDVMDVYITEFVMQ
jgi:flagellar FliL protein